MDKRLLARILAFGGAALVLLSVIMLIVSAVYVDNVEDAQGVDMNGSDVKHMLAYMDNIYDETDADEQLDFNSFIMAQSLSSSMLSNLDGFLYGDYDNGYTAVNYTGFGRFALYARGWMFWLGIAAVVAGVTVGAVEKDRRLSSSFKSLVRRYGEAALEGAASLVDVKAIIARVKPRPRPSRTTKRQPSCPVCGAPYEAGAMFCGECGARLGTGEQSEE